jgi:hypothetical protein
MARFALATMSVRGLLLRMEALIYVATSHSFHRTNINVTFVSLSPPTCVRKCIKEDYATQRDS